MDSIHFLLGKKHSPRTDLWLPGCALLMTALTVALYWVIPHAGHWEIDSSCYEQIARWIMGKEQLAQLPWSIYWGYSTLLAGLYTLFGYDVRAVIATQLLLAILLMYVVYRMAYVLAGTQAARIAALLTATNLGVLVYTQLVLTEILLALVLALGLERLLVFLSSKNKNALYASGLFFGCSILVKPAAILFGPLISVFLVFAAGMANGLMFGALFYLPVMLCALLNFCVCGYYAVQIMGTYNLYYWFAYKLVAAADHIPIAQAQQIVRATIPTEGFPLEPHFWDASKALFTKYVTAHPVLAVVVWITNVCKTAFGLFVTQLKVMLTPNLVPGSLSITNIAGSVWLRPYAYIVGGSPAWWVTAIGFVEAGMMIVRYACVAASIGMFVRKRSWQIASVVILFCLYFLMITGHDGCGRYRMMIEPLLIALSAVALAMLHNRVQGVRNEI